VEEWDDEENVVRRPRNQKVIDEEEENDEPANSIQNNNDGEAENLDAEHLDKVDDLQNVPSATQKNNKKSSK
jgi:hypothetical protein